MMTLVKEDREGVGYRISGKERHTREDRSTGKQENSRGILVTHTPHLSATDAGGVQPTPPITQCQGTREGE